MFSLCWFKLFFSMIINSLQLQHGSVTVATWKRSLICALSRNNFLNIMLIKQYIQRFMLPASICKTCWSRALMVVGFNIHNVNKTIYTAIRVK